MIKQDRKNKFDELREKFPVFIYESHSISSKEHSIKITYCFSLPPNYSFYSEIEIPDRSFINIGNISPEAIDNLAFNIGMVEMLSYWKATCSPLIVIKPHLLNEEQIIWWKKLYFQGLGEFFYLNSIIVDPDNFVQINCEGKSQLVSFKLKDFVGTLIPVGGGKDSIVSLELLRKTIPEVKPLILNPREATLRSASVAGYSEEDIFVINRSIDKQLLKLNDEGFLNGHTPFSALLAFISLLAASVCGAKNIALSNEASADESTVAGTGINHQYSKSFEFEKDFKEYVSRYICPELNYFSFLRPLHEIQIARIFSRYPEYFFVFRSCNAGSKNNSWCGKCAKCLFTFIILSPFIDQNILIDIFGSDLLDDTDLKQYFDELTGASETKPFDCIGTVEEVNISLCATILRRGKNNLPVLLNGYFHSERFSIFNSRKMKIHQIYEKHFLDDEWLQIIKNSLYD